MATTAAHRCSHGHVVRVDLARTEPDRHVSGGLAVSVGLVRGEWLDVLIPTTSPK